MLNKQANKTLKDLQATHKALREKYYAALYQMNLYQDLMNSNEKLIETLFYKEFLGQPYTDSRNINVTKQDGYNNMIVYITLFNCFDVRVIVEKTNLKRDKYKVRYRQSRQNWLLDVLLNFKFETPANEDKRFKTAAEAAKYANDLKEQLLKYIMSNAKVKSLLKMSGCEQEVTDSAEPFNAEELEAIKVNG